ncbi:MAG: DinB family protein [Gemmatimonadetes bacterium]|jgi:hypothetical protein|nr:DinB family protein [Gemmatimonadota bacterium]MBK7717263.1 DinB family protein [Gemmatimonadota bacterium]MBK7925764.1 DinB family protein [Gemmatimonadota bacterium]MBK9066484.1 DinB family protein [Gemmatimonadota bacterium]MBK9691781.1 DinB family protein [Gemmatimonadota bacterium]
MASTTGTTQHLAAEARAYTAAILAALGDQNPLAVLRETPEALRQLIAGRSAEALARPEAPGKWSARQVLQHLADSELVGGFRFRMVLAHDRPAVPGYDQDRWAERLRYQDNDPATSIADFTALRRMNLVLLERATPADLARVAIHAERGEESLAHMLRMYAGHDLVHRRQIKRVLGG